MKDLKTLQIEKKLKLIEGFAKDKLVERNIVKFRLDKYDKTDLAQMVYLYLLEMDVDSFFELVDNGKLHSYIRRMAVLQYKSSTSRFYKEIIKFKITTNPLDDYETI